MSLKQTFVDRVATIVTTRTESGGFHGRFALPFGPLRGLHVDARDRHRLAYFLGTYERHIARAFHDNLTRGQIAYDVGANVGYMSLALSRIVGESGRVFSFEPDPATTAVLERNVAQNGLTNVSVSQTCMSDRPGLVKFATFAHFSAVNQLADQGTPGDATIIDVTSTTLDEFVFAGGNPVPALIKIDTEGAEAAVMEGGRRLLGEARPVVIAEVRAGDLADRCFSLMSSLDYRWEEIRGGSMAMDDHGIGDFLFTPQR